MSEPLHAQKVNTTRVKVGSWIREGLPILAASLVTVAALIILAGASARAGLACQSCHTMERYAQAAEASSHSALGCEACHAGTGLLDVSGDGVAVVRMALAEPFVDAVDPARAGVTNARCLSCHGMIAAQTVVSRGIAAQHADFMDVACTTCHAGTGHALDERHYRGPEMEDCTTCHTASVTNLTSCETCHVADAEGQRRDGRTAWRATHGAGWETSHGMGELESCTSCHPGDFCVSCHGVKVPHGAEWARAHGRDLLPQVREACSTCHEPAWCEDCHGVEMPHAVTFLPEHEYVAAEVGEQTCTTCHNKEHCNTCHLASSHPDLPGIGMGHAQ